MVHLDPGDLMRYQKVSDPPRFSPYTSAPRRLPGETPGNPDLGTIQYPGSRRRPPNSDRDPIPNPHQLGGGLKYALGSDLNREDMAKLWSTKYLLVQDERGLLVWYHILNHCSFKSLLRLSKRGIIPKSHNNPPLCILTIWEVP